MGSLPRCIAFGLVPSMLSRKDHNPAQTHAPHQQNAFFPKFSSGTVVRSPQNLRDMDLLSVWRWDAHRVLSCSSWEVPADRAQQSRTLDAQRCPFQSSSPVPLDRGVDAHISVPFRDSASNHLPFMTASPTDLER